MAYRNKTYVCFDGDSDIHYYRLMQAYDLNTARDTSQEESIKRQLRIRLQNSKVFVVLIGANTRYLTKFVRWEMEQALSMRLPIIGINLNGMRQQDPERCPPVIRNALAIYISFNAKIMQYALEHWPSLHSQLVQQGQTGPHFYKSSIYQDLGLYL